MQGIALFLQTLRGGFALGSLGGETSTVQEHRERVDEGEQAEQRQADVHLHTRQESSLMKTVLTGGEGPE